MNYLAGQQNGSDWLSDSSESKRIGVGAPKPSPPSVLRKPCPTTIHGALKAPTDSTYRHRTLEAVTMAVNRVKRSDPLRTRSDGGTPDDTVRERLESLDRLTRSLLADIQTGEFHADLETADRDARLEATRHIREIRAEASRVGLLLFGPEMAIPYRPDGDSSGLSIAAPGGSLTTAYRGPEPEALERERQRQRETEDD